MTYVFITESHIVKSAKTQTGPGVRQFYFSPTHGTYIPVATTGTGEGHAFVQVKKSVT